MARSKFERRAQTRLERDGWLVDYKIRPSRPTPNYNTDYWNLFDLAAYKKTRPVRFVSVKPASVPSEHRKALEQFDADSAIVEVWSYRKLKSRDSRYFYVKAQRFVDGVWITLFDERALTLSELREG